MNNDALKQAMQRRKSGGFDLQIIIGEPKEKQDAESDLAPEAEEENPISGMMENDLNPEHEQEAEALAGPSDKMQDMQLMKQMMDGGALGRSPLKDKAAAMMAARKKG